MRLGVKEREILRERVSTFKEKNPTFKKSDIVKHFMSEGYARTTVYNTLERLSATSSFADKKKLGRPSSWTAARKVKLKRLTNNRKDVSQRKLARKFDVDVSTICRQLSKMQIKHHKREKAPNYTPEQRKRARIRSRKLYEYLNSTGKCVIMDDEKYFTWQSTNRTGYYTSDKKTCPDDVRFAGESKFPKKVLMWVAISERGMSKALIRESGSEAINKTIYIRECLEKRLLPFIKKHHSDANYIFWPDLAPAHKAKDTVKWMSENINFVRVEDNPPNVPQARPIEDFWGCLSQKVYEGGWEATSDQQLINRIEAKLKEFDRDFFFV